MPKMAEKEVESALADVPEWALVGEAIQRTYHFPDFVGSMRFVSAIADAAEAARHHPDVLIRYSKVTLTLATHDAGGITDKDFRFAKTADDLYGAANPTPAPAVTSGATRKRSKA